MSIITQSEYWLANCLDILWIFVAFFLRWSTLKKKDPGEKAVGKDESLQQRSLTI